MQVPKRFIKDWAQNIDRGDMGKLSKHTDRCSRVIKRALEGEANADLIVKIDEFFQNKKKKLNK